MFRHVVMFRWAASVDQETRREAIRRLWALPDQVAEVRAFEVGLDAGLDDGNFDVVVVVDFDDVDSYQTYASHPAHTALVVDWLQSNIVDRAAVQHPM